MSKVGDVLSEKRVLSFEPLLAAHDAAGLPLRCALDGGAGSGSTSRDILRHLSGSVYAFEPFPGNHRFFDGAAEGVRLIPKALADIRGSASFRVSSVVEADSVWGRWGMEGYSSSGRLADDGDLTVECVRADDEIPEGAPIDFVKLDLQGGELGALKGMPRIARDAHFLWVEYIGGGGLVEWLEENRFVLFDTAYMFWGEPTDELLERFEQEGEVRTVSNGRLAWKGFRREPWEDFRAEFLRYRHEHGMSHTDLVCVQEERLDTFRRVLTLT
jgi:FkbM family methyltransferase